MFSWLWKSSPPPSGVHIIPCTGIDLNARDLVMTTAFILDGRLDAKQLETSLSLLVESKFPRAGARLVKRDGRYEFHIPQSFDAKTRAVSFTSEHRPEPYESPSRPSLTNLCYSSVTRPFVCEAPALQPFFRAPGCPNALEGFLKLNTPLVHVHVATFEDLTFIGVTSSHTMFDAIGTQTLIHAWTRILSGEPVHDIPGMPWDVEPFATFTTPPRGWHQRGWFNLGLVSTAWFIVLFVLRLVRDAKETMKYVRVPKTFLDDEKRNITEELKSMGSEEWVGSSLGLTSYQHRSDATPLHLHLPVNLRDYRIFPTPEGTIGTPFLNNSVMSIPIPPFTIRDLHNMSLGKVALQIRRAIIAYNADLEGLKNDLHWRCANPLLVIFPCPPGAEYAFQTNWRTAKFAEMDFSGALYKSGGGGSKGKARVLAVTGLSTSGNNTPMRGGGITMFENEDCIWMGEVRGEKDWAAIREAGAVEFI